MATSFKPVRGKPYTFYVALVDQANTKLTKANPTLAAADFNISKDGGTFTPLTTTPSALPASGRAVRITLTGAEMDADNIVVQCVDAAGAEWCDQIVSIEPRDTQIDNFQFLMRDTLGNEATGKTITATYALDSATSFSALAGTITEVGNGFYRIPLTRTLMSSYNDSISLRFTATGCMPTDITLTTPY